MENTTLFWLELYWIYRLIQEVWYFHTIKSSYSETWNVSLIRRSSFMSFIPALSFSTENSCVFLIKLILDAL